MEHDKKFEACKRMILNATEKFEERFMCGVQIDTFIFEESIIRALKSQKTAYESSDAPNGYNIDSFKMAGLLCFWLRKLKPFTVVSGDMKEKRIVNEAIAFLTGFNLIIGYLGKNDSNFTRPKIPASFFNNIILSFRYNSHSPNSTAFIFESIFL